MPAGQGLVGCLAQAARSSLCGAPHRAREWDDSRSEGRKRAKANGVKFGWPFCLSLDQRKFALAQLEAGETMASIAKVLGVDPKRSAAWPGGRKRGSFTICRCPCLRPYSGRDGGREMNEGASSGCGFCGNRAPGGLSRIALYSFL
jgi:hypothetical protein